MLHALTLALLLLATADPLVIDTSKLADGETMTATTPDGAKVTIVRKGDTRHVLVESNGQKDELSITPDRDGFRVGSMRRQTGFLVRPQKIVIDGVPVEPFVDSLLIPRSPRSSRTQYFVCPNDETWVRVQTDQHDGELKCPIDGTTLQRKRPLFPEYYLLN
jgi:hypothetical protein